jgi:hypothetical protein
MRHPEGPRFYQRAEGSPLARCLADRRSSFERALRSLVRGRLSLHMRSSVCNQQRRRRNAA